MENLMEKRTTVPMVCITYFLMGLMTIIIYLTR